MEKVAKGDKRLMELVDYLKELNKNPELLLVREPKIYEAAEQLRIEEAREDGIKEGTKKMAEKMLEKKMDIKTIQELTGLDVKTLEELKL